MNEANTHREAMGPAGETLDQAHLVGSVNSIGLGFCGFLTADLPELHAVHPQRLAAAWARYTARLADGSILGFAPNAEG